MTPYGNPLQSHRCVRSLDGGFTILEVLVAFAVAAILSLTFIAAQHRALQVAEEFAESWEQINLAQEYFTDHPFDEIDTASMGWAAWKGRPEISRRIDSDREQLKALPDNRRVIVTGGWTMSKSRIFSLNIRKDGRENEWKWIGEGR